MDRIQWSEQFSSGISDVDDENRILLNVINKLIEIHNSEQEDIQLISPLLSQIQDYALRHFSHEEEYLAQARQEDLVEHRDQHLLFKKKVAFFCFYLFKEREKAPLAEFCQFLSEWFISHTTDFNKHAVQVYCRRHLAPK